MASQPPPSLRTIRITFYFTAVLLGALQAWSVRHAFDSDGISYVEIGEAYLRGDWNMAINAYWSPLYSWLLGVALYLIKPSAYWEFATVHLINFLIYLLSIVCFEFFVRELIRYYQRDRILESNTPDTQIPPLAWILVGYSLFLTSNLSLINIKSVSPDMLVGALVSIATALQLRLVHEPSSFAYAALMGVTLGFGYLAKAAMFPITFLFTVVAACNKGTFKIRLTRSLATLIAFLALSLPFVCVLSMSKGRFTFGDAGRLNYAWFVNKAPAYVHWQGQPSESGKPAHPTKRVFDAPAVYEFGSPIRGTYAPWYDPSYWNEGLVARFNPHQQIRRLLANLVRYADILTANPLVLILAFFLAYILVDGIRHFAKDFVAHWQLIALGGFPLMMYSLVLVEQRYVAPFIVLIFGSVGCSIRRLPPGKCRKYLIPAALILFLLTTLSLSLPLIRDTVRELRANEDSSHPQWQVAKEIKTLGVLPGDTVAVLGDSFFEYWARLARVRIVVEIPHTERDVFWSTDRQTKCEIIKTIAKSGAKFLVAREMNNDRFSPEWQRLGNNNYYALELLTDQGKSTHLTTHSYCS